MDQDKSQYIALNAIQASQISLCKVEIQKFIQIQLVDEDLQKLGTVTTIDLKR